jgi:hypothetical protein
MTVIDAANSAANRPSIFVIGPEGSGSTLVSSCVALHPQLQDRRFLVQPTRVGPLPQSNAILHLSLPTLRPMRWVEASELPDDAMVVAVRRSPLHTVYSAYRRYFDHPQPAWRSYLRAVATEAGYLERLNPFCLFYEDLVHNPRKVMRALYSYLGVDSEFMPALAFTDRNDERWRDDWRFASFVARTFGIPLDKTDTLRAAESVKLSFGCYGANIAIDDASGAGIADALRKSLPPDLDPASGSVLDIQYRIETRWRRRSRAEQVSCACRRRKET